MASATVPFDGRIVGAVSDTDAAESVTRRVKRWRDGDMRQRWCAAGLLNAKSRFHRIKGYKHLPQLLDALDRLLDSPTLNTQRKRA